MKTTSAIIVSAVLIASGSFGGVRAETAPGGQGSLRVERDALLATLKNFGLLLNSSKASLGPVRGGRKPTYEWYRDALAALNTEVAANSNPDAAALDGQKKRYDALKQAFIDHIYGANPARYNRDRNAAVRLLQEKEDAAVALHHARSREGVTAAQAAKFDRISKRLAGVKSNGLWGIQRDISLVSQPATTNPGRHDATPKPRTPTVRTRRTPSEPPPPTLSGILHKRNMADYQKLVPWLNTVLEKTGTAELMRKAGIKPLEFTLALISAESGFSPRAGSSAGAHGYMQLLTTTAKSMIRLGMDKYREIMGADRLKVEQVNGSTLKSHWKTNVFAGVTFLNHLIKKFSEPLRQAGLTDPAKLGPVLQGVIAAGYNAGGGAVRRHWKRLGVAIKDPKQSIVPFKETRAFVLRIAERTNLDWTSQMAKPM